MHPSQEAVLAGGGEMGERMRAIDWSKTPLGPVDGWPQSLKTCLRIILTSRQPMFVWWGNELINLYNDAYKQIVGGKHPAALGQPASVVWREIWDEVGPRAERAMRANEGTYDEALLLIMERNGYQEETYYTFSYSPVPSDEGGPGGIICANTDDTQRIIGERQLVLLRELAAADTRTREDSIASACAALGTSTRDLPFALIYVQHGDELVLSGTSGIERTHRLAVAKMPLVPEGRVVPILGDAPRGVWDKAPSEMVILPFDQGALVVGRSPYRLLDAGYRGFLTLVAGQIGGSIAKADAYEAERRRAEALAEIDRAKTVFFSNISHEFRTPLTLMLGPQEDALASPDKALTGSQLASVHRNTLRLLKLVNALLDFSRLEAGRMHAQFRPTNVATFTREIASAFESAIQRGGLTFVVDAPTDTHAYVDRDMWEKIVLNLVSNAYKFTMAGSIQVSVSERDGRVVLAVADTGTGIPAEHLPMIFQRFHRVEGASSRSHEGSGIGLALVHDLVGQHGGSVEVTSAVDKGTTFTVTIPQGTAHLPADRVDHREDVAKAYAVEAFVAEATRWLPDESLEETFDTPNRGNATILVADDNADMRGYITRLLEQQDWRTVQATDGLQAEQLASSARPDLIVTDVMMPNVDGFALLGRIRANPATATIPVIMLSARAGDEARVEGLEAGADDYLVKPFSAKELVARVSTHLQLARARQDVERASRAKDEFLAMLGHELRNPLAPIVTALQLMKLRGIGATFEREHTVIERQTDHLVRLVDDLLDISRITRGKIELKRQPLEVAGIVAKAIEIASPLIERRRHNLELDVARNLVVEGDPFRLAQVVSNLLNNAAKYTEPSGRIAVSAARSDGFVDLVVADTGIGIDPETLPTVFDMFVQERQALDRSQGGLGLGLSIVKNLVVMHGGSVSAASPGRGHGATFTVRLPASDVPDADRTEPAKRDIPRAQVAGIKILIVDDNEDAATALADYLDEFGHTVKVVHDGPTALRVAEEFHPDLGLLDIGLPVMDGYELARKLRHAEPQVKLVAVSGYGADTDRQRSTAAGFDAHMVKPVELGALSGQIAKLVKPPS